MSLETRLRPHCGGHASVRRRAMEPEPRLESDLEERVVAAVRDGADELLAIASELIAFDTTARLPGEPARDEGRLQEYLRDRLWSIGGEADLWEPDADREGPPDPAARPRLSRPAAACRPPGRDGRRSQPALNGHIDAVSAEPRDALDQRPVQCGGARRPPLRARQLRHEGRHRRSALRADRPASARAYAWPATSSSAPTPTRSRAAPAPTPASSTA